MEHFLPQIELDCYDAVRRNERLKAGSSECEITNEGFCMSVFNAFTGDRRGQRAAAIDNNGAKQKNPRTCQAGDLFFSRLVSGCQIQANRLLSKPSSQEGP
jgi:hypothetical protein